MCPDCSGIVCTDCHQKLPKQGNKPKCAKCRQYANKFVRNRQVEEMLESVLLKKKEVCAKHSYDKGLYCVDCKIAVCPLCFFTEEKHKGHS